MKTNARALSTSTIAVAAFLVALLIAAQISAAPEAWPKKKGELCWVADALGGSGHEYSFVRAMITNMGHDHYLFHGQAYRVIGPTDLTKLDGFELQALGGNVEFDPDKDAWIGQITKTEYLLDDSEPPVPELLEVYTGLMDLDSTTLDGSIEGVISTCEAGSENTNCGMLNTGPIDLIFIACP